MAVRHQHVHAVGPAYPGGARTDALDRAVSAVQLDKVVDTDRPLRHQYPAADEVVDDVLRTETDADRDRAGRECKRGQRNAEQAEGGKDDEDEDGEEDDALQDIDDIRAQRGCRQPAAQQKPDKATCEVPDHQEQNDEHDLADMDGLSTRVGPQRRVPDSFYFVVHRPFSSLSCINACALRHFSSLSVSERAGIEDDVRPPPHRGA